MVGTVLARHQQPVHILRTDGIDGQRGHQRRIHSSAQSQHRTADAVLAEIVPQAAHQSLVHQHHSLGFLVVHLLYLLHVNRHAGILEIGHLAQHTAGGIHRQAPARIQVRTLAARAVHVDQARIQRLHNLAHAVACAVRLLIVKHIASAAHHQVRLVDMASRQLLQVLVESDGNPLVVELHHLHSLAPHEATLFVGRQILLGHNGTDGTILYKHNGIAEALVLDLQRQTHQERSVLAPRHKLLQGRLGTLLQVGVARRGKKGRSAERAGWENGEQGLATLRRVQLGKYPFEVLLGSVRKHIVLNNMYIHLYINYFYF